MKTAGVLVVLFFALCCFSGVNGNDENDETKVSCDKYTIYQGFVACPKIFREVCGTDGKSYEHECKICEANVKSGQNIGMKYKGQCAEEKYCGMTVSPTPVCTKEHKFHCGSNGKNYNNKCEFCNAVWESKVPLILKNFGQCESVLQES